MVIQKIQGGLGNQMFQYAFVKALSLRKHIDFKLDISQYKTYFRPYELEIFNIEKKYTNKGIPYYEKMDDGIIKGLLTRINFRHHYENSSYRNPILFNSKFLNINYGYISGSFMSELYFKNEWELIKDDFEFIKPVSTETKRIENLLNKCNSVSIHIRRGDYLKHCDIYPELGDQYYEQAINIIKKKIKQPFFVFFSDDIDYVQKHFSHINNSIIVDNNRGNDSWQDMYLMSKCKHNITAHSTFSRRGAYLNKNKEKLIISPKEWFVKKCNYYNNNIVPDSWIKI